MKRLYIALFLLLLLSSTCARDVAPVAPATALAKATPSTPVSTATPAPTLAATVTSEPILSVSLVEGTHAFPSACTFEIALADFDGDGDLDGAFANMEFNPSRIWLNDGSGSFEDTGQELTEQGHGIDAGDLDGDGDVDLFVTCAHFGSGGMNKKPSRIYLNDGEGTFEDSGQDLGDTEMSGNGVTLFDIDGDGDLDAHVVYYEVADRVYLNDGQGTFTDNSREIPEETTWGDLDGDGDVDVFFKQIGHGYGMMLNDGAGDFSEHWQMAGENVEFGAVALGDYDGDGDLDAFVTNGLRSGDHPSLVLTNDGTGRFTDSGQRLGPTNGASLGVGDLSGDGYLDVFISNMERPNEVWVNDGTGHFIDSEVRLGGNGVTTEVALGDLDDDGDLDVLVGNFRGEPEMWWNEGK